MDANWGKWKKLTVEVEDLVEHVLSMLLVVHMNCVCIGCISIYEMCSFMALFGCRYLVSSMKGDTLKIPQALSTSLNAAAFAKAYQCLGW